MDNIEEMKTEKEREVSAMYPPKSSAWYENGVMNDKIRDGMYIGDSTDTSTTQFLSVLPKTLNFHSHLSTEQLKHKQIQFVLPLKIQQSVWFSLI